MRNLGIVPDHLEDGDQHLLDKLIQEVLTTQEVIELVLQNVNEMLVSIQTSFPKDSVGLVLIKSEDDGLLRVSAAIDLDAFPAP